MFTCDDRRGRMLPEFRRPPIGGGVAALALVLLLACSSNDAAGRGEGGSSAGGGHAGGTGGDSGSGGAGPAGRGGVTAPSCSTLICIDAGAGGNGGTGPADAGQSDAANDASGALACGTMTCGPQEACVHPPGPGTCLMPDAGQCPSGTSLSGGCCLPPLIPSCVAIDRPCSGSTVTCACFSVNPCAPQLCAAASFQGRVVMCHGA